MVIVATGNWSVSRPEVSSTPSLVGSPVASCVRSTVTVAVVRTLFWKVAVPDTASVEPSTVDVSSLPPAGPPGPSPPPSPFCWTVEDCALSVSWVT